MKKLVGLVAVVLVAAGGAYFGSPYLAARNLKAAAISGDADRLEAEVDFPAVRSGLKGQMAAAMTRKMAGDPALADNPFARLGMLMIPAIIDKAVDAYVTPDGVAALVRGAKPGEARPGDAADKADLQYSYEWLTMDRFRVNLANGRTHERGPSLVFARRGVVTWRLVKIDIADNLLRN